MRFIIFILSIICLLIGVAQGLKGNSGAAIGAIGIGLFLWIGLWGWAIIEAIKEEK